VKSSEPSHGPEQISGGFWIGTWSNQPGKSAKEAAAKKETPTKMA
jgi:hypothetical protein